MLLVSDIHVARSEQRLWQAILDAYDHRSDPKDRVVVIAGDLVQHPTEEEYEVASDFVDALLDRGALIVLTPGNHDFGVTGEHLPLVGKSGRKRFEAILEKVRHQPEVIAHNDFDLVIDTGSELFMALRSTHRGKAAYAGFKGGKRITSEQLDWVCGVLEGLDRGSRRLHLVTHRSLWEDPRHSSLDRRRRLEERLLVPFKVDTFIHGHNHRYSHGIETTPKTGYRLTRIGLPTLSNRDENNRGFVSWDGRSPTSTPVPL
ncbi:MAG: metallophosphoesterase [Pseudomonadota bacterium]